MPRKKRSYQHMLSWPWWLRLLVALPMLGLGVLGLLLPIMPGWIFIIPGLVLIFGRKNRLSRWILLKTHRLRRWLRRNRKPKTDSTTENTESTEKRDL